MGDMSDDLERLIWDDDFDGDFNEPYAHYWTQKDSTEILLQDMSTSHIKNCISLIKEGVLNTDPDDWLSIFLKELNFRKKKTLNNKLKKVKEYKEEIDLDKINGVN